MIATVTFTKVEVTGSGAEQESHTLKYTFNVEQIQLFRETFKPDQTAIMLVGGLSYTVDATYDEVKKAISDARIPCITDINES